jgi:hypothetical protein
VHDESIVSNENMTYLDILSKGFLISDLKVPQIGVKERGRKRKKIKLILINCY